MDKHPIDFSDIPPMRNEDRPRVRFGNERALRSLPPDLLREMTRRRLAEMRRADTAALRADAERGGPSALRADAERDGPPGRRGARRGVSRGPSRSAHWF